MALLADYGNLPQHQVFSPERSALKPFPRLSGPIEKHTLKLSRYERGIFWRALLDTQLFVSHYGYLAVYIGTLFEGEIVTAIAGLLSQMGKLSFVPVVLCATAGALSADSVLYWLGRVSVCRNFRITTSLRKRAETYRPRVLRQQIWILLGYRFFIGMRASISLALGMSRVSYSRFLLLGIPITLIWATLLTGLGFYFARSMAGLTSYVTRLEQIPVVIGSILLSCFLLQSAMRRFLLQALRG